VAAHAECAHGDAVKNAGEPAEYARLRARGVENVRPLAAQQERELGEPGEVAPDADRTTDVPQGGEAVAGGLGRLARRPGAVSRDRHVERADERGKQRGDVG